jgi:hypothetical protein
MMPRGFHDVPNWLSPLDQGASVAVSDVTGNGTPDLIVLAVDSGRQPNRAAYRIGRDLDAGGDVVGGWTQWHGVPNWTSRDTQGAGIAVTDLNRDGRRDVVIFMVNNAAQLNTASYRVGRGLDADGKVTGGMVRVARRALVLVGKPRGRNRHRGPQRQWQARPHRHDHRQPTHAEPRCPVGSHGITRAAELPSPTRRATGTST